MEDINVLQKAPEKSSEQVAWEFFISKGFTAEQTAGIMGNLKQEHNFKTSDVPGGLGIAQWMGARRERLIQRGSHLDLNSQLNFIIEEFETTESAAYRGVKASSTVEQSTIAFQNLYERCGKCMQDTRIQFALNMYYNYR